MDRRRILLVVAVIVAVVGAGLVFLYAQGTKDDVQQQAVATTQVLVATAKIEQGESASDAANANKIQLIDVPVAEALAGSTSDGNLFKDTVALADIYPGEQLLTQKFGDPGQLVVQPTIPLPKGDQLMTITVDDVNHVSTFLQPGSHVAVWFVPISQPTTAPSGQSAVQLNAARVLLPDLLVLSVGGTTTNPNALDANGNPLATTSSTTIGVAVNPCETSLLGGASFGSGDNLQTFFFTLIKGKNRLKTDPTYQTKLPTDLTCSTTSTGSGN